MTAAHVPPANPSHPIPNYTAMEILVFLVLVIGALILRSILSVETPGKFQQLIEVAVEFVQNVGHEIIGHESSRYVALLGTLGFFVLFSNILGLIPSFETPTGAIQVTLGCAVATFLYYNYQGIRHHGLFWGDFSSRFRGPIWWIGFHSSVSR